MLELFDYWFDTDWKQRDDINELMGTAGVAAFNAEMAQRQLAQLRPLVFELSATVAVLTKMLAEAGQLDPKVLQYRIEAEIDARRNWKPEAQPTIKCSRCLREVVPARTLMTGDGAVCDPVCSP